MVRERKITRDVKTKTVHTTDTKKDYRVVFTKRVRLEGGKTLPYGHKHTVLKFNYGQKRQNYIFKIIDLMQRRMTMSRHAGYTTAKKM